MNKQELIDEAKKKGADVFILDLKKYKRMKTIAMINELPQGITLEVMIDTSSEIIFRAKKKEAK